MSGASCRLARLIGPKPFFVFVGWFLVAETFGGEIKPIDSDKEVLYFTEASSNARLSVSSLRHFLVDQDGRGITLVLNEADKNQFAELVRKFPGGVKCVVPPGVVTTSQFGAMGDIIPVEQLTRVPEAGLLSFGEYNHCGEAAENLRHRFGKLSPPQTIKPRDSDAPVLQYFSATQTSKPGEPFAFNIDPKPLLTVSTIRDLIVYADGKGVAVLLNADDAKKFAELSQNLNHQLLFTQAADKVAHVRRIGAPYEEGIDFFDEARKSGDIAAYLRKRFGK